MSKRVERSRYTRKTRGEFKPVVPKLSESGFIRLRVGIFEHAASGKMTPYDFAIYLTLHKWANWRSGICTTTAASLASNWGDWGSVAESGSDTEEQTTNRKRRTIQNCLHRLRERGYINYRTGDGKRGAYPILINKYEPSLGALVGWSLDLAATTDLDNPVYRYVSPTPFWEAYGENFAAQHMTSYADHGSSAAHPVSAALYGLTADNSTPNRIVRVPFQDILAMTKQVQEDSRSSQNDSRSTISDEVSREDLDHLDESKQISDTEEDDDNEPI